MDDFLNALPWRLAALASLIIGAVSFLDANTDFWSGLERIGAAFALFYFTGAAARKLLIVATPPGAQTRSATSRSTARAGSEATEK